MRPLAGEASSQRRPDNDEVDVVSRHPPQPGIMCFMATEAELDASAGSEISLPRHRHKFRIPPRDRSADCSSPSMAETPSPPSSPMYSEAMGSIRDSSIPVTPILAGISRSESAISCASSPQNFSNMSSIFGREALEDATASAFSLSNNASEDSAVPQLVMPSLTVPKRRMFTESGRSIGKLSILVTGPKGIGKSLLIQSISKSCEHIVHMDAVRTTGHGVTELHASTRPYSWWRQDPSSSEVLRRRRSSVTADDILDRNISFIECTIDSSLPSLPINVVESKSLRLLDRPIGDVDLCKLLSSGAEPIIDAVIYMIPHSGPSPTDVQAMKRLQLICNIIPVLARSDEIQNEDVESSKLSLDTSLASAGIQPIAFSTEEACRTYAVSSALQSDRDIIDASVLMNSGYVQPLLPTDLTTLVDRVFSPDGAAQLRHAAAAKLVMQRPFATAHDSSHSALTLRRSGEMILAPSNLNPFASMKSWNRIEVSSWAQSLRQSLDSERLMTATLAQPSRAELARVSNELSKCNDGKHIRRRRKQPIESSQDPLGLMGLAGQVTRNGTFAVELLSGIGIIGYIITCIVKPEQASPRALGNVSQWWLAVY